MNDKKPKRALGRGLSALMADVDQQKSGSTGGAPAQERADRMIPIERIHSNPNQPTMYDTRLRLSNQVVEEVKKHFGKMVFKTIIQRNIRLSEAPSFGEDIITYDASSRGAKSYLSLGSEIIKRNK